MNSTGWLGVYRSTVDVMPHPVDEFDGWRRRREELASLADEIDAVLFLVGTLYFERGRV